MGRTINESPVVDALQAEERATAPWLNAPPLPPPSGRVVTVASEAELQQAVTELVDGTTIVLQPGTYPLTRSLWIEHDDVTIRGATDDHDDVVLVGRGMENRDFRLVPNGLKSQAARTKIQNLTIRDVYFHPIQFGPSAEAPEVYNVKLLNAGQQFIKSDSARGTFGEGVDYGSVQYTIMEYTDGPPSTPHGGGNTGYTNGVDVLGGKGWVVRHNLFKNFHTPDSADSRWNPAVLMWRGARDSIVEGNTFINVDRAIAFGLVDNAGDHHGGIIRNNMIYSEPGLLSAARRANSDGMIIVWDSQDTIVDHNTILTNGNQRLSIEFRFDSDGSQARNNLVDAPLGRRNGGSFADSGNQTNATPSMFVDPPSGNLRLLGSAIATIDQVPALPEVTTDIDGELRPIGDLAEPGADEIGVQSPVGAADFDRDGQVGAADIDLLAAHIRMGGAVARFDLNGDQRVDSRDVDFLVRTILGTTYADSNLDGVFDSTDLLLIFQAGQYEDGVPGNSTWSTGDWNGDGDFDSSDLILAFQTGAYKKIAGTANSRIAAALASRDD